MAIWSGYLLFNCLPARLFEVASATRRKSLGTNWEETMSTQMCMKCSYTLDSRSEIHKSVFFHGTLHPQCYPIRDIPHAFFSKGCHKDNFHFMAIQRAIATYLYTILWLLENPSVLWSFKLLFSLGDSNYFPEGLQKELKDEMIVLASNVQDVVQNLTVQSLQNLVAEIPPCKIDLNILSFNFTTGSKKDQKIYHCGLPESKR